MKKEITKGENCGGNIFLNQKRKFQDECECFWINFTKFGKETYENFFDKHLHLNKKRKKYIGYRYEFFFFSVKKKRKKNIRQYLIHTKRYITIFIFQNNVLVVAG